MTFRFPGWRVLLVALLMAGCGSGAPPSNDGDYTKKVLAARAAKDAMFKANPGEPVPPHLADQLIPLSYFAPDPGYVVPASLKPAAEREVIDMPTSTGEIRKEERMGVLEFTLKGQPFTLSAFHDVEEKDRNRLFVPFRDLTNGTETYQAGRYLDIDRTATGLYSIDFNTAYHPYCYYNSKFDCPYPPAENRLAIPVRAGERLAPAKSH